MVLLPLAVCLFFCIVENNGSTSEKRFIQTDSDLQLTVTNNVQLEAEDTFFWILNGSINIVRLFEDKPFTFKDYRGRVIFSPQNLSIKLKNVQLSDSGIYTASVLQGKQEQVLITHDVTVEAPVSPVQLSVDHVTNSSESCNFTVSCSSQISSISVSYNFFCDRHTCEEPRPLTPDHAPSLQINWSNELIICNHSNHVSRKEATKNYREICQKNGSNDNSKYSVAGIVTGVVIGFGLVVLGGIFVRRRRNKMIISENTVYEVPMEQPREPCRPREVTESPTSIYSEVQPHTGSAPIPSPPPRSTQAPESVYSTVNKPSAVTAT